MTKEYEVLSVFGRDGKSYTQGLIFDQRKGLLLESAGGFGKSRIHFLKVNEKSKKIEISETDNWAGLDQKEFGEGCDIVVDPESGNRTIVQLTWQTRRIIFYDEELNYLKEKLLPSEIKEGWGLTHDPSNPRVVYITSGTSDLFLVDIWQAKPRLIKSLKITFNKGHSQNGESSAMEVPYVNELEFVNGKIWGNIYYQNVIVVIDPATGDIERVYDMTNLVDDEKMEVELERGEPLEHDEVLNGIAYDAVKDVYYVTGKNWLNIYLVKFN